MDNIRAAKGKLRTQGPFWYRGHANPDYILTPTLFRAPANVVKEKDLFNDYERSAARLMAKRDSDWELLFDMQHYGIPTRLLDWTEVLGVAIAFAMYDSKSDCQDSAIYILDPVSLNSKSGIDGIKRVPGDPGFEYKSIYWDNSPFAAIYPIAIDPPLQSDRMFAQKATFTIHGRDPKSLGAQCPDSVQKVLLPSSAKPAAREFLEHAALDAYSIYPDIVGMARHIRKKHLDM
ncbi:MAG TPA: FRG domain-containing protein [Candidatus Dormibacteraeota bacterium]|nr:FRG domain-containing protein [Candidatus Dormibacteraeota bacterium]